MHDIIVGVLTFNLTTSVHDIIVSVLSSSEVDIAQVGLNQTTKLVFAASPEAKHAPRKSNNKDWLA